VEGWGWVLINEWCVEWITVVRDFGKGIISRISAQLSGCLATKIETKQMATWLSSSKTKKDSLKGLENHKSKEALHLLLHSNHPSIHPSINSRKPPSDIHPLADDPSRHLHSCTTSACKLQHPRRRLVSSVFFLSCILTCFRSAYIGWTEGRGIDFGRVSENQCVYRFLFCGIFMRGADRLCGGKREGKGKEMRRKGKQGAGCNWWILRVEISINEWIE